MSGWPTKKLIDLVDPERGISYGVVQPGQPTESGVPIVRVNNVRNRCLIKENVLRICPDIEGKYVRTRLRGGEILLTIVGTVGETCIVNEEIIGWNVARAIAVVPPMTGVSSRWIQICLETKGVKDRISSRVNTTVQTTLNLKDIAALNIPYPPNTDRVAIEQFICALDDKIELNRGMNATLEAMTRALFKSWFVDFDPVRAKMEGKQPFGMDSKTAALFPSRLVPSELGDIPEGWSIASIYDIADIVNGAPFQSELFNQEKRGLPLIRIRDLNSCNPAYYTDEKHPKAEIVHTGDIVVGMDAEFRAHYWMGETAFLNQRLFTARPKHNSKVFVREGLIPLLAKEENAQVGTTVAHIGKKDIDKFKVVFPGERILQLFAEQSNPILEKMVAISIETRKLEKTRDYLLPKLISGDIRIPDAEKFVEAV